MATTGRSAVVPANIPLAINTKHLCCISLDQTKCIPEFLHGCILYHPSVLKQMGGSERGAIMPGLNMELIKNLIVPLPKMRFQKLYVSIVRKFSFVQNQQREAERQAEMLFQSLLQWAFMGEQ